MHPSHYLSGASLIGSSRTNPWAVAVNMSVKIEGFIAFRVERAGFVEQIGKLTRTMFGSPYKYIPFRSSPALAVEKVLESRHSDPRAATEESTWLLLNVIFTPQQVCEMFNKDMISKVEGGWRFYGDVFLQEVASFEWLRCTFEPIGLEQWSKKTLKKRRMIMEGTCAQCKTDNVTTWCSSKLHEYEFFCVRCWNSYYSARFTEDVQTALEEMRATVPVEKGYSES